MTKETTMPDAMKDPIWQTLREKIALQEENEKLKRLLREAINGAIPKNCIICVNCQECLTRRRECNFKIHPEIAELIKLESL